jgi:lipopolysaccharide transport system permease protein
VIATPDLPLGIGSTTRRRQSMPSKDLFHHHHQSAGLEIRIHPRSGWLWIDFKGLIEYRDLIFLLIRRDFVSKYAQTILGPAWAVVTPIVTAVVFAFVFGRVLGVATDGVPPQLFYLCGLLGWNYFNQTLTATSNTLRGNYALFSKVYFPRLTVPLALTFSNLAAAAIQLLTFAGIFAFAIFTNPAITARPTWAALALPVLFIHLGALALGGGLLLSAITAKYRDFQHVAPFFVNLLMYVTPVIYPASKIPGQWQWLAALNPVSSIIEGFRAVLLGTPGFHASHYAMSVGFTLLIFTVGVGLYQRLARDFVDYA